MPSGSTLVTKSPFVSTNTNDAYHNSHKLVDQTPTYQSSLTYNLSNSLLVPITTLPSSSNMGNDYVLRVCIFLSKHTTSSNVHYMQTRSKSESSVNYCPNSSHVQDLLVSTHSLQTRLNTRNAMEALILVTLPSRDLLEHELEDIYSAM